MEREGAIDSSWECHVQNIRAHQQHERAAYVKLTFISNIQPTQNLILARITEFKIQSATCPRKAECEYIFLISRG